MTAFGSIELENSVDLPSSGHLLLIPTHCDDRGQRHQMTGASIPNRPQIQEALRRVGDGELSPAEATQILLQAELQSECSSQTRAAESLASILDRLGAPPRDVVDSLCQQLTGIAALHEQETGQSLPPIGLAQWAITADGELTWQGRPFAIEHSPARPQMQASLDHIHSFRGLLLGKDGSTTDPVVTDQQIVKRQTGPVVEDRGVAGENEPEVTAGSGNKIVRKSAQVTALVMLACDEKCM